MLSSYSSSFFFLIILFSLNGSKTEANSEFFATGTGCMKFDGYPLCSGKGKCIGENASIIITEPNIPGSRCDCDSGWTGVGDLMDLIGTDCSFHIESLRGLFGLSIALYIVSLLLSLHRLYFSYMFFKSNLDAGVRSPSGPRLTITKIPIRGTTGKLLSFFRINVVPLAVMAFLSSLGGLIYSGLRVTDPGNDAWVLNKSRATAAGRIVEVAFFFSSSAYFGHSWMTMTILMSSVTGKTREEAHEAVLHMRRVLRGAIFFGSCLTPFFVLLINLDLGFRLDGIFTLCYCQAAGLVGVFLTFAVVQTGRTLVAILSKGLECLPAEGQKSRLVVINNIKRRMRASVYASSFNLILSTVVAWYPFLRTKVTWMLPVVSAINQFPLALSLLTLKPPQPANKDTSSQNSETDSNPRPTSPRATAPRATSLSGSGRRPKKEKVKRMESDTQKKLLDSNSNTSASLETSPTTVSETGSDQQQNDEQPVMDVTEEIEIERIVPTSLEKQDSDLVVQTGNLDEEYAPLTNEDDVRSSVISQPTSSKTQTPTATRDISQFGLFVL